MPELQTLRLTRQNVAAELDVGVIYTHEDAFMPPLLESLSASGDDVAMRLLLVDNASESGVSRWENCFERTEVVQNPRRLGYGPNLNRILEASSAEYVLLLNTDMRFDPAAQCLGRMTAFMDDHPQCGVAGCRLYHEDGGYAYPARRFLTPGMIAARRLGLVSRPLRRHADRLLYADRDPESVFECDWLSGCFLMVRRAAWLQIGGFDERFAKYFEDVDFCARMAAGGWKVMFNGGTYGYHLEQRGSTRLLSRDAWLHLRSYAAWLQKWGLDPARTIARLRSGLGRAA